MSQSVALSSSYYDAVCDPVIVGALIASPARALWHSPIGGARATF
jgi:hypothetical protein